MSYGQIKFVTHCLEDKLRLLIQNHQWSLFWNALVFSEFQGRDFGILIQLQKSVRSPESEPAITLRMAQAADISDYKPVKLSGKTLLFRISLPEINFTLAK